MGRIVRCGINLAPMKHIAQIAFVAASLLPLGAPAQWLWVDIDGRKVFSDRAPPGTIPEKNILQRPGQPKTRPSAEATDATGAAGATSAQVQASSPKISGIDKDLAEKKKKAEQAEFDKRKAEEAKASAARADNCARARSAKAGLDSGVRLSRINAQGQREIIDDGTRAAETQRLQSIIETDCK